MSGLTIVIQSASAKSLVPQIDMNVTAYVISGSGPNGATFSTTITSGTSASISMLAAGAWTVAVDGKNAAGVFIAHGSGTAQVTAGNTSTLSVTMLTNVKSVGLAWDANKETNLAGYKLYTGTASGVYEAPTILGLVTTTTVSNLKIGTTYYFALTAFLSSGLESAKSAELSYTVP